MQSFRCLSGNARDTISSHRGAPALIRHAFDERDFSHLHQLELALRLVGEDSTEQDQEHEREDNREEDGLLVSQVALEDRE